MPKPKPEPPAKDPKDPTDFHIKVLGAIAVIWTIIFVIVLLAHSGELRMLLPVIAVVFLLYLIFASVSVILNKFKP